MAEKVGEILGAQFLEPGRYLDADNAPEWLADMRLQARAKFSEAGLPQRRIENWRYTSLAGLDAGSWQNVGAEADGLSFDLPEMPVSVAARIVLFRGRVQARYSTLDKLPDGARLLGLADRKGTCGDILKGRLGSLAEGAAMPLATLNTAWLSDGAVLILDPGILVDAPIEIVSIGAPTKSGEAAAFHPRMLVVAGAGSSACLIERHHAATDGPYFSNSVAEIFVGPGARIAHTKIQNESLQSTHLSACHVALEEGAHYRGFILQKGAALARHEVVASLGPSVDFRISGAYLGVGEQHLDTTIRVDHAEPGSMSRQHIKGVLTGKARGVFQGKITVHQDAQQTDGQQMSRALLLSPQARVSVKPELEIYADDVKCGHGATSGALSDEALFYLTARGIDEEIAKALLIGAFVEEVVEEIEEPVSRADVRTLVGDWLSDETGFDWRAEVLEEAA
jgi:Fe-S cluster assembly protein SufD